MKSLEMFSPLSNTAILLLVAVYPKECQHIRRDVQKEMNCCTAFGVRSY